MNRFVYSGIICAGGMLCALATSTAFGQPPHVPGRANAVVASGPRQPGGLLTDHTGKYLTIEGVKAEGGKLESNTLLVDTVDGKKLDKPVQLVVHVEYIKDHNLRRASFNLPSRQRCVFKGYESGEMVGVPPAVYTAAKEQGWKEVPMSPGHWHWRPHFVALIVVEPKEPKFTKPLEPNQAVPRSDVGSRF